MPRGWPPTVTAPAGRGGNWPTEAPRLGLSKLQTCTGRSSRAICGTPTPSFIPASPRHWRRWPNSMNEAVAAPISHRSSRRSARTTVGDPR